MSPPWAVEMERAMVNGPYVEAALTAAEALAEEVAASADARAA